MNKPIFIDFGCGPKTKHLIRYRKKGYYVISVDRSEQDLYENSDIKDISYYELVSDEISFFDITDLSKKTNYPADVWNCGAVMEHIEPNQIDPFLYGIKNNCKKGSRGVIYIDLTDHFGGFDHRVNPEKYNHFIKNAYEEIEWFDIIGRHFEIEEWWRRFKSNISSEGFVTIRGPKNKFQISNSGNCIALSFYVFV